MRRVFGSILASLLIVATSCSQQSEESTRMAVDTSLGKLVLFEKLHKISKDDGKSVEPNPGELLVAIHFEGKTSFPLGEQGIVMIDQAGTRFLPEIMGSPVGDGELSDKDWRMDGNMTARDGKWVFVGQVGTPQPRQVFIYRVPEKTSALAFVDGDRVHPLMGGGFPERIDLPLDSNVPGKSGSVADGVAGGVVESPGPSALVAAIRVGGQIPEPKLLKHVPPHYPEIAAAARVQGSVVLELTVSAEGRVTDAKVLRGVALLDQAAIEAAEQWVYAPTVVNGKPVPVILTTFVSFKLQERGRSAEKPEGQ